MPAAILYRCLKPLFLIVGTFLLVELGWFALVRLTADWRAVTVRKLDHPKRALPADGRVRIATYNISNGVHSDRAIVFRD